MHFNKLTKRAIGAAAAAALVAALGAGAASAAGSATGNSGFTQIEQTRVFDSGRIAGDAMLASGRNQLINPNATKTLVPAGATAVEVQITVASETSINGDLDVHPNAKFIPGSTSNLNYVRGVAATSSTVAQLNANGEFYVYNHAGSAGSVRLIVDILGYYAPVAAYTPPVTLSSSFNGLKSITTGGPAAANAVEVTHLDLTQGTYQVSVNAKATPNATTKGDVFPQFFVYDGAHPITGGFTGDLFNIGSGALENPTAAELAHPNVIDSYYSGSGLVTVPAGGETLYVYAFGYDSDGGSGTYALDQLSATAVPVTPAS